MIGKNGRGRDFGGLVRYLLRPKDHAGREREHIALLSATLPGGTAKELATAFGAFQRLRPTLKVNVHHGVLAFRPDGPPVSDDVARAVAEEWAQRLGFEDWVVVRHGMHVHVAASRIRRNGETVPDGNDFRRSETIVRDLEAKYRLAPDEASRLTDPGRPLRKRLREAITDALGAGCSYTEFADRLRAAGVQVRLNAARSGRVSGISFAVEGGEMKGSAVGRPFSLGALKLKGLTHVPEGAARHDHADPAGPRLYPERGADDAAAGSRPGPDAAGIGEQDRPGGLVPRGPDDGSVGEGRMAARDGGGGPGTAVPARSALAQLSGRRAVTDTAEQVRTQLEVMACASYEVGVIPPKGNSDLKPRQIRTMTATEVRAALPSLKRENAAGYDIYIRPAPLPNEMAEPLVFVDDLDDQAVADMHAAGFRFCVRIRSSAGRYHGWVRVDDKPITRKEATRYASLLAKRFGGDPAAASWRQFGRLAGFTNRKPSRAVVQPDGRRLQPFAVLREVGRAVTHAARDLLRLVRELLGTETNVPNRNVGPRPVAVPNRNAFSPAEAFRSARERSSTSDESARDFAAALSMLRRGFRPDAVAQALLEGSPDLAARHHNPEDYVRRTIAKAEDIITSTPSPRRAPAPKPRF